jgi:acetyl esterase/lipase
MTPTTPTTTRTTAPPIRPRTRRHPLFRSLRRLGSTLAGAVLTSSILVACSDSDDDSSAPSTSVNSTNDASEGILAGGDTGNGEIVKALDIRTSVPGDDPGDRFVERINYPVREGAADPDQNWADFYLPEGDHEVDSVPLVIFIHGGAWHGGASNVRPIVEKLAERGMAVLNVEYRDISEGGGYPQTFSDVADALDYVPALDQRHPEITTDDETVVGHSAGAQLAAWAGTRGDLDAHQLGANPKFTPSRVVSLAGPLDLVWAADNGDHNIVTAMKGTPEEVPDKYNEVDPIQNISRKVPVVAMHGLNDNLVPKENSEHYVDAVTRAGGSAKLVLMEGEDHVSFLQENSPHFEKILDVIHKVTTHPRETLRDKLDGATVNLADSLRH